MSEYKQVKLGKLRLKGQGDKEIKKKSKKKRKHISEGSGESSSKSNNDELVEYNGWWPLKNFEHLNCGIVAIQTCIKNCYMFAKDNGTLALGNDHDVLQNGVPVEEEMLTIIQISENKIALKTGYGKYISVNARGDIVARTEAVGPQEQIEVIIQDEKMALQGHNGYFITVNAEGEFKALSKTAKEKEIFCLRTNSSKSKKKKKEGEEDVGDVRHFEVNYVKQFQSFKGNKLRLHEGPASSLEKARTKGKLHEAMLDRREKMKADRYCK